MMRSFIVHAKEQQDRSNRLARERRAKVKQVKAAKEAEEAKKQAAREKNRLRNQKWRARQKNRNPTNGMWGYVDKDPEFVDDMFKEDWSSWIEDAANTSSNTPQDSEMESAYKSHEQLEESSWT